MTLLKLVKTSETKNFINFEEFESGLKICLMKEKFNIVLQRFIRWRNNPTETNFTTQLFNLICKADDRNKIKFLKGFPEEMVLWLLWYTHKEGEEGFMREYGRSLNSD